MLRIITCVAACLVIATSGLFADMVKRFTTMGSDGCKEWMILQSDALGCRTFWRNCGDAAYQADPCGWEDCASIIWPLNPAATPYTTTNDHGIIFSVAPGMGGYFVPSGPVAYCGGYSVWAFQANGSSVITIPPLMAQLPGIH